jgi:hypothetical protein
VVADERPGELVLVAAKRTPKPPAATTPTAKPAAKEQLSFLGPDEPAPTFVRKPPKKTRVGTPLQELRDALFRKAAKGKATHCPLCDQYVKIYERKLNGSMAYGLIVLFKHQQTIPPEEWIHIPSLFADKKVCKANDGALLRHWGLIVGKPGVRDDGSKRVGYYRVTELGIRFVKREATVPERARLYNQVFLGLVGDPVTIDKALHTRFSYDDLMGPSS